MRACWLILLCCWLSMAKGAEERYQFDSPEQQQLYLQLAGELRCPKCQNQSIGDSDAMIAEDLRRKTYELVKQGHDRQAVIDFMKQRYGDFVHYQPPLNAMTVWLWLLPLGFVLIAVVWLMAKKPKKLTPIDEQAALAEAEKLLSEGKRQ